MIAISILFALVILSLILTWRHLNEIAEATKVPVWTKEELDNLDFEQKVLELEREFYSIKRDRRDH